MTPATDTLDARAVYDLGMKLPPAERERVALDLLGSLEPPPPDEAAFAAELRRRVEQAAGGAPTLSRAEAEAQVRAVLRGHGVEL